MWPIKKQVLDFSSYIIGIIFIGLGFLIKAFPGLIAGYNTLSDEEKKNVDVDGLSTYGRNCLVGIGLGIMIAVFALQLLQKMTYANYVVFPIILVGMIAMIVGSQKYDHNS